MKFSSLFIEFLEKEEEEKNADIEVNIQNSVVISKTHLESAVPRHCRFTGAASPATAESQIRTWKGPHDAPSSREELHKNAF